MFERRFCECPNETNEMDRNERAAMQAIRQLVEMSRTVLVSCDHDGSWVISIKSDDVPEEVF